MNYVKFVALALLALVTFKVAFSLMGDVGGDAQTGNGLVVEPRIVDVGTVPMNQAVNFSTSMRNNSQKPIQAQIKTSCHCLSAYPANNIVVQPGATIAIGGTIVGEKPGRFRHSLQVIAENSSPPEQIIEVVGSAAPPGSSNQ